MTNTQEQADRRKQKRFNVQKDAFVAVGPHFDKVGPIIDVSMGGLALSYVASRERTHRKSQLHILSADGNFFSDAVRFFH